MWAYWDHLVGRLLSATLQNRWICPDNNDKFLDFRKRIFLKINSCTILICKLKPSSSRPARQICQWIRAALFHILLSASLGLSCWELKGIWQKKKTSLQKLFVTNFIRNKMEETTTYSNGEFSRDIVIWRRQEEEEEI